MGSHIVRMRHSAPTAVAAFLLVVVVIDIRLSIPSPVVPRVALATAALCWFGIGLALRARAWRVADTPITKTRAATIGECEFSGIAQSPAPQAAPGSGISCAWYHWKLQRYVRSGKSSHWHTEEESRFENGFWLTDDTGSIWIDPRHADFDGFDEHTLGASGRSGKWRQLEWRLPQTAPVYALGPVASTPDGRLLVACAKDSDEDFLISDDSKRTVTGRLGKWAWLSIGLGAIAGVLVPLVTVSQSTDSTGKTSAFPALQGDVRIAVIVAAAYLAALSLSWLVRVFNRLVIVRNQAQKAWASIEVQEQRRHDLIENLVTVVKQYAAYERTTLTDIAAVRAEGSLPTDAEVDAATAHDSGSRAEGVKLIALAEAYPQLHANEQFTQLSTTLADVENRIALARQFYNDAVNVMRDRRNTFPYLLIAPLVPLPSLRLFGEDATLAPKVPTSS